MRQPTRWKREKAYQAAVLSNGAQVGDRPCPLKGCRAPELACDGVSAVFDQIIALEALCVEDTLVRAPDLKAESQSNFIFVLK